MHKPLAALTAAMILMMVASTGHAQAPPVITSAGDLSNSPQRDVSGTYIPVPLSATNTYSYIRLLDGNDGGFYFIGNAYPDKTTGHWSIGVTLGGFNGSPNNPGAEGEHAIIAVAMGDGFSELGRSAPVVYTLLRNPPVLTFAPVAALIGNPALSVSGTISATLPVSIYDGGVPLAQVSAAPDGKWSAHITLSGAGAHTLTAAATDAAGNRGASPAVVTTLNLAAPTLTLTGVSSTSAQGIFELRGSIDAADIARPITIYDGAILRVTVPATNIHPDGSWTVAVQLAAGAHSLTAKATNGAGTGTSAALVAQGN
jgi:hypothetical protein